MPARELLGARSGEGVMASLKSPERAELRKIWKLYICYGEGQDVGFQLQCSAPWLLSSSICLPRPTLKR